MVSGVESRVSVGGGVWWEFRRRRGWKGVTSVGERGFPSEGSVGSRVTGT